MNKQVIEEVLIAAALSSVTYWIYLQNQEDIDADPFTVNKSYAWPYRLIRPGGASSFHKAKDLYIKFIKWLKRIAPPGMQVISFEEDSAWIGQC